MITLTRIASLTCCLAVVMTLSSCGSGDTPTSGSSGAPDVQTTQSAKATDPCAGIAALRDRTDLLDVSISTDWSRTVPELAAARDELEAVTVPKEIASDWATVTEFFALVADAFEGVDLSSEDAIGTTLTETLGPETETKNQEAKDAVQRIEKFAETSCEAATPVAATELTDACTLLSGDDLKRVFAGNSPDGEGRSYGQGSLECIWEGPRSEVSIMLMPVADFTADYLDKSEPLPVSELDGLGESQAYMGVVGIGRFNTRGHSVSFTTDKVGGFVSVRQGETSSRPVEVGDAERLARIVYGQL